MLACEECGGRREQLAFIMERDAIERILPHLGLPTESPFVAPARPPPGQEEFD